MVPAALHGEWPKVAQPPTIIAEITAGAQTNNPKAGNDLSDLEKRCTHGRICTIISSATEKGMKKWKNWLLPRGT